MAGFKTSPHASPCLTAAGYTYLSNTAFTKAKCMMVKENPQVLACFWEGNETRLLLGNKKSLHHMSPGGCWHVGGGSLLVCGYIKSSETIERKWTADSAGKSSLHLVAANSSQSSLSLCHTKCGSMPPLWVAGGWTSWSSSMQQIPTATIQTHR